MFEVSEFGKDQNEANPKVRVLMRYTAKEKTPLILHRPSTSCLLDCMAYRTFHLCFSMFTVWELELGLGK